VPLSLSTLADQIGACCTVLRPVHDRLLAYVLAADRLLGDDTTVPVLARGKTIIGRCGTYVRDDRPFGGRTPPAAVLFYSRDRFGEHPQQRLADWGGILQTDAYSGYGKLYDVVRRPRLIEAACWAHARRKFFVLADIEAGVRRRAQGRKLQVLSPIALEAVQRIDALLDIERDINGLPAPSGGWRFVGNAARHWSTHWKPGCVMSGASCLDTATSPARWTTCSSAGRPSPASSRTAKSVGTRLLR